MNGTLQEPLHLLSRPKNTKCREVVVFSKLEHDFTRHWLSENISSFSEFENPEDAIVLTKDALTDFLVYLVKKPVGEWKDVFPDYSETTEVNLNDAVQVLVFKLSTILQRFDFERNEIFCNIH
jgi:hypothetical protein